MKISKEARRVARQLMKATVKDGRVDGGVVRKVVARLKEEKPRGYLGMIAAYGRLVRLELEKHHAIVESAVTLADETRSTVEFDLQKKYDGKLTVEYKVNPALIGGMRVRVGSDVWDGSVKGRLERLKERIG
ncbi:MAG: F0F1 ATP synthase subunit delta [Verrucomicrobiae bacterium]|nr:F0F1 ATP synthase subunit delta [Verrucomicrobiae bacterium]